MPEEEKKMNEAWAPEDETDRPWEPKPIPAESFHQPGEWVNINRAPYDQVSGVLYKRAADIKRVRYEPADAAPELPEPWQGEGPTIVRWLFSEQPGTEEHLLEGRTLAFIHDTSLLPGSRTGMQSHVEMDELFYVIEGEGCLQHRPTAGSPVVVRRLRPGDAALVRAGEYHQIANGTEAPLRLIVTGLALDRRESHEAEAH